MGLIQSVISIKVCTSPKKVAFAEEDRLEKVQNSNVKERKRQEIIDELRRIKNCTMCYITERSKALNLPGKK